MDGDRIVQLVALGMMLVLVASSLAVRRLPVGQLAKIALAWIAIFVVALGLVMVWLSWRGSGEIRLIPRQEPRESIVILHNVDYQTGGAERRDG